MMPVARGMYSIEMETIRGFFELAASTLLNREPPRRDALSADESGFFVPSPIFFRPFAV